MKTTTTRHLTLLFLIFSFAVNGQKPSKCSCSESFEELYTYIEQNYAGWKHKVNENTRVEFNKITNEVREVAKEGDPFKCFIKVVEWSKVFKDGHLTVSPNFPLRDDDIPNIKVNDLELNKLYRKFNKDEIEGIWYEEEGDYKVAIVKSRDSKYPYHGVVLESKNENFKPGMVKFGLSAEQNNGFYIDGGLYAAYQDVEFQSKKKFTVGRVTTFIKQKNTQFNPIIKPQKKHEVKVLDDSTLLFTLPALIIYGNELDSFYREAKPLFSKYKNLIIDIRDVSGGNGTGWTQIRPYVYSGPTKHEGEVAYLSPENSKYWLEQKEWVEKIDTTSDFFKSKEIQEAFLHEKEALSVVRSNYGSYKFIEFSTNTYTQDSVYKYPEKIALIVNKVCGSQAEHVCLEATQSSKVTIYGESTAGVIDYIDIKERILNCDLFNLVLTIGHRANLDKNSLDKTGFMPDVNIPKETKDWVEFVRKDMKKR